MKRNNALSLWGDIGSLHRGIDRWFEEATSSFNPPVDVEETEDQYILHFDLPGVAKEDVKIEMNDNQLFVTGERKYERDEQKTRHFAERYYGSFQRTFGFPSKVDADKIEAAYRDGVLTVIVPKSEAAKPRTISIGEGKSGLFTKLLGNRENKKDSAA